MDRVGEIMRLFSECSPIERAEVLSLMRARVVETRRGAMTHDDFVAELKDARTLDDAAAKLGISRRTLQYHMRLFGMPPGRPGRR